MEELDVNGYPECVQCGKCCEVSVLAMTIEEAERIFEYAEEHGIVPRDNGEGVCPWRDEDMRCALWSARPQVCRLHGCGKTRFQVLEEHPGVVVRDEEKWYVDLRKVFLFRDFNDPREQSG